jgi:hypothetical protein
MKKYLLFIGLFFLITGADASNIQVSPVNNNSASLLYPLKYISDLSIKEIQELSGRKLKLNEKIAFKIFQLKIKKEMRRAAEPRDKGRTAQLLGIIGLATLFIPVIGLFTGIGFALAALIIGNNARREDPYNKAAKTGIILGWITLGIVALATIIVIAVLSSFSISFGG